MANGFDREMQEALEADGAKLAELTGEDHGPVFVEDEPAKHTPGPWTYLDIGEIVAGEDHQITIAIMNDGTASVRVAEVEANANLIAAAPALLAALQAFMPELEQREHFISAQDSAWSQSQRQMLDRIWAARKAVKDAGGEA